MDDPGNVVAEAVAQQRADEMSAVPQPDTAHGVRNLLDAVQPPAMPETGRGMRDAGMPDHGRFAEPDASASMAPLATGHERIGGRIESRQLEAGIESAPAGFLQPAPVKSPAKSPAAAQPSPVHGAEDVPDWAVKDGDGLLEQERRKVAKLRLPESVDLQNVASQGPDSGFEAVAAAPASQVATEVTSTPGVAEYSTPTQQEAAIQGSVGSRPVTPAPAAVDVSPARRSGLGHGATLNAGPQVHIGHIDIVVLAPEQARPQQPPLSASADLASRHYLRRL